MNEVDLEEFGDAVSVLPLYIEDENGELTEVVTCISIEKIRSEMNDRMPSSLALVRKFEDGRSYTAIYRKVE